MVGYVSRLFLQPRFYECSLVLPSPSLSLLLQLRLQFPVFPPRPVQGAQQSRALKLAVQRSDITGRAATTVLQLS